MIQIGVLGIQGAFARHEQILSACGATVQTIKYREQLPHVDALVIPGGESTTMTRMMGFRIDYNDILNFGKSKPVFGTCAGLILLGRGIEDPRVRQLSLIDADILRNAYGSQKESFVDTITLDFDDSTPFSAVFIRAPRIRDCRDSVRVLARHREEPVLIENTLHLGATFHPELTNDQRIHRYFIQKVKEIKYGKTQQAT
jgi:pyridoxal 5'-phosphate synthase pdxT subunit